MATLTIKNIPERTYRRLKQSAKAHHRSMNSEVIICMERTLLVSKIDAEELLRRARELRKGTVKSQLTDRALAVIKNEGRP